jgi:CBS domain-containing protein
MHDFDLPVDRHMLVAVRTIRDNARLSAAALALEELGISALPVEDAGGRLAGALESADLRRASHLCGRNPSGAPRWSAPEGVVAEWMRTVVPIVSRRPSFRDCARRMVERGLRHLYVVDDRELCGLLGTREVMLAVARARLDMPLSELARAAGTISSSAPASAASAQWAGGLERAVVVVDGDAAVGVFGRTEMLGGLDAHVADATELWMDRSVLVLPASTPAHVAAEQALGARARYVIGRADAGGFHVVTGLAFAACIAGERPSAIPPAPIVEPLAGVTPASPAALSDEERRPRPFSVASAGPVSPASATSERERARERDSKTGGAGPGGVTGRDPRTR